MKKIASLILFVFSLAAANSRTIQFPVAGFDIDSADSEILEMEWDEKWFGEMPSTIYNHNIARIACLLSELSYVDVEKDEENNELTRTYRLMGINNASIEYHYDLDYSSPVIKNNQVAFSIASKEIDSAVGKKTLVYIVIRGTPKNAQEWTSNVSISDSTSGSEIHEGFFHAMMQVKTAVIYYLLKHKIDPDETFLLITGHSRGAAVSNLLGAVLCDENLLKKENMYVYTFATPNVSTEKKTLDENYGFIWNIVNAEDVVPTVPPNRGNWHFKKYGHTLTLVNRWNVEANLYENEYLPRMNEIFSRLVDRNFSPLRTGSFIPAQISRLLTSFYGSIDKYYGGMFGMRTRSEKLFAKAFKKGDPTEDLKNKGTFVGFANQLTNGSLENIMTTVLDMHLCESYLSWMVALNEDEVFSYIGSSQLVIDGTFEGAVYDSENNLLLQIYDGIAKIGSVKPPIAIIPFPKKTIIGFPGTEDFKVVVYKDSIIPTRIPITVEHYNAAGVLESISPVQKIYPHLGTLVAFDAGKKTLSDAKIDSKKLYGKQAGSFIKKAELQQQFAVELTGEAGINTEASFGGGLHFGNREFYASFIANKYSTKFTTAYELCGGIGHQQTLYGTILMDSELYGKFVFHDWDDIADKQIFVPSARISLSVKPMHKTQLFIAGEFDLKIDSFNSDAFDKKIRPRTLGTINLTDKYAIIPGIRFGIKF